MIVKSTHHAVLARSTCLSTASAIRYLRYSKFHCHVVVRPPRTARQDRLCSHDMMDICFLFQSTIAHPLESHCLLLLFWMLGLCLFATCPSSHTLDLKPNLRASFTKPAQVYLSASRSCLDCRFWLGYSLCQLSI